MSTDQDAYHHLCAYTLTLGDPAFIHQYVVDAYAVQHADERTRPITLTFGLIGLYLKIECGFTGREVQLAHMALARRKHTWPAFTLPRERGAMTAETVMAAPPGAERHRALDRWCDAVWQAFADNHDRVARLIEEHRIAPRRAARDGRSAGSDVR